MMHGDVALAGRVYLNTYAHAPVDADGISYDDADEKQKRAKHLRELHVQQAQHHALRFGAEPPAQAFGGKESSWQAEAARRQALDPRKRREQYLAEVRQRNFVLSMAATRVIAGAGLRTARDASIMSSPERIEAARRETEGRQQRREAREREK